MTANRPLPYNGLMLNIAAFIAPARTPAIVLTALVAAVLWPHDAGGKQVVLASTTSLDNSGLYEHLLPHFTDDTGIQVSVVAVGTGRALEIGRNGDADAVIVHDRQSELAFINAGYGINCATFMYNYYAIVGPAGNPAGITREMDAVQALRLIANSGSLFISRGDDSGTHKREQSLWRMAGIVPPAKGSWYYESGRGMGAVLTMANELLAYTLSDSSTWLSFGNRLNLVLLIQGGAHMYNPYSIILTNPARHAAVNHRGARRFAQWLTSEKGLSLVERFQTRGVQAFYPLREPGRKSCNEL